MGSAGGSCGSSVSRFAPDVLLPRGVRCGWKAVRNFSRGTFGAVAARGAPGALGCAARRDGELTSTMAACACRNVAGRLLVPITNCGGQSQLELENAGN